MRIDGPPFSAMTPFMATSQPMGTGLMFGDLFSDTQAGAGEPAKASVRPLFSFDALGVLGLGRIVHGEQQQDGLPLSDPSLEVGASPAEQRAHLSAVMPAAILPHTVPQPVETGDVFGPASAIAVGPPSVAGKSVLHASLSLPVRWGSLAAPFGAMERFATMPDVSVNTTGSGTGVFNLRTDRSGFGVVVDAPEAGDPMEPGTKRAIFTAETRADPASGQVSVAVAEKDGAVHVIAAAPGLSDEARLKIRGIVEDLAADAGVALGEFSLNGATLPNSFITVRRSSHGGFGHKRGI